VLTAALLFSIVAVAQDHAAVRSGCSGEEAIVATLPAGTPVELRFAVSDGSDCYKIAAIIDGKRVEGYVSGASLSGTEQFERERRNAPPSSIEILATLPPPKRRAPDSDLASGESLYGMRVALHYQSDTLPQETARTMVSILDEEFTRISMALGCPTGERVTAIVQSRKAYLKSTDAVEWSAGQFDGRIRVSFPGADRRVLAHELVHACLANISANWPAWLQEGIAQKLSGDTLSIAEREQIRRMAASHALPRLENMGQTWSRMNAQHARAAYSLALAAAELLSAEYGDLRNVLANPDRLPQITVDLDRRLGL